MSMRRYFSGGDGRLLYGMSKDELKGYLGPITEKEIAKLWVFVYVILANIDRFNDGNLILSGDYFNSQLKIYKDKFFVIDFENILRCYSIKDGVEIWNVKTETSLIRSQKNSLWLL